MLKYLPLFTVNCLFFPSVSGVLATEPVVSRLGHVFEDRLIRAHLEQSDVCPVTNQPLTVNDLIPLQGVCVCLLVFKLLHKYFSCWCRSPSLICEYECAGFDSISWRRV